MTELSMLHPQVYRLHPVGFAKGKWSHANVSPALVSELKVTMLCMCCIMYHLYFLYYLMTLQKIMYYRMTVNDEGRGHQLF